MKNRKSRGFTLIEVLVVITIIAILASLLVVLIASVIHNARYERTMALIEKLDMACGVYHVDFHVYPDDLGSSSSKGLHLHLGTIWYKGTQVDNDGTVLLREVQKPFVEFRSGELMGNPVDTVPSGVGDAVEIVDSWGNGLVYNSSFPSVNTESFDLSSNGKDGVLGDPADNYGDDVVNWQKEH